MIQSDRGGECCHRDCQDSSDKIFHAIGPFANPCYHKRPRNHNDGPGTYLVQLVVTDASGNTSTSPVITLNYQP